MTGKENSKTQEVAAERIQKPVIGFDAKHATLSTIAKIVLRAESRGHSTIMCHNDRTSEAARLASYAGALVLSDSDTPDETVPSAVVRTAKAYGFPSLVWHGEPSKLIDYAQSVRDAEKTDEFVVTATTVRERSPEWNSEVMVGIPAYNESGTIGEVVTRAKRITDRVFVVDDGSDDRTGRIAEEAGATVIAHERNQGYGAAIKTAFIEAAHLDVDHLVILDGDAQHDPSDIPKLVKTQHEEDAEIVIGSRFLGNSSDVPLYRQFGLWVVNTMTNVGLGAIRRKSWVSDTQSGFRSYNREAIRSIAETNTIGDGMSASTDIIYHAYHRGYSITEVETEIDYDVENGNSHDPISHGLVLISNLLRLIERERPITFIGAPGFVTTFVGIGLGYVAFTSSSEALPLDIAFAAVFFALTGVLACFSAIVLHSIKVHIDP